MADDKTLQVIDDEATNKVAIEKKKFTFRGFFKDKKNIFALSATVLGLVAIALFLFLPSIIIDLTSDGKDLASLNAATIPDMLNYNEVISGLTALLGGSTYTVWHNVETSAQIETQTMAFNIPMLVGVLLCLAGSVIIVVLTLTAKSNVLNKVAMACFILGGLALLFAPIWFYMVNPITASTRYDTKLTIYPYGSINAHCGIGAILAGLSAIAGSVFSSLLIAKPVETR